MSAKKPPRRFTRPGDGRGSQSSADFQPADRGSLQPVNCALVQADANSMRPMASRFVPGAERGAFQTRTDSTVQRTSYSSQRASAVSLRSNAGYLVQNQGEYSPHAAPYGGLPGHVHKQFRRVVAGVVLAAVTLFAWIAYRLWPRHIPVGTRHHQPSAAIHGRRVAIPFANEVACAEIASFDDQLEAFLRFEYLRGRDPSDASNILLSTNHSGHRPSYKIYLLLENDQLVAISRLNRLQSSGLISHYELVAWTRQDLAAARQQSQLMDASYHMPANQKLESLPSFQLLPALADFLAFKSQTDWRVVRHSSSAPQPLTHQQALHLASDILDVAHFYDLPLDYFLGVGAMENNYMNVNGDLAHTAWKTRAEAGDIVLERGRKRVLVSDYSVGAWQISRETIRSAHQLYLKDKRNYSKLSPHLRPPRELDLNAVTGDQLTTYAGLVLRNLLDRFGGDVDRAVGAYNGGVGNPNPNYAANVKNIALYARRVLEHAPLPIVNSRNAYSRESLVL